MQIKKKELMVVSIIFIVSLILYGYLACKMSAIVFYPGDESRFLSLAKSLHYSGNVSEHYMVRSYDDVLYPLILSIGYFFYSPEHILDIFRLIGVILMSSVVFPTYFLAKKMEVGKIFKVDGAIFLTVLSVLIPELTYTAYLLEEVLLYPLFMWMLYLTYSEFMEKENISRINIPIILVFFLMYATKTFAIVFAATYCFVVFVYGIVNRDKKIIMKSILTGVIFLVMVIGLKAVLFIMNGMQKGYSHYEEQALSIFPFTYQVFVGLVRGLLFYLSYFILFTGIIPVLSLCSNFKIYNKKDILWAAYLLGLIVFTIIEIVMIIHYSENGTDVTVSRFHYRYLFYFFLPMLMLLIKYKNISSKQIAYGIIAFEIIALSVFFIPVNKNGQGICDGIVCLFIKRMNDYAGFTDSFYILLLFLMVGIILLLTANQVRKIINGGFIGIFACILIILPFSFRTPVENSSYVSAYINDYILIADYINENAEKVVCVSMRDYGDPVLRACAYSKKDFKELFLEDTADNFEIEDDNTVLLVLGSFPYGLEGSVEEINLGTDNIRVYEAQKGTLNINKDEYNIDFSSYAHLVNGYDEAGKRYLDQEGISYGPYIHLAAGRYQIEVIGGNLTASNMFSYSGSQIFEEKIIEADDEKVILEIEILQDISDFEFSVRNTGATQIMIDNITIKKID